MKKLVSVLLCVLLVFGGVSLTASADDGSASSGTLKFLSYNVSGLPVVGDFQGSVTTSTTERATKIGKLLNSREEDFIGVQEDFDAHAYLAKEMTSYPYQTYSDGTMTLGSGLNMFSGHKLYNIERVRWEKEYGVLSGSADNLSNKGFVFGTMELAEGVYIDVIVLHTDAGYDPLSVVARADNFRQLAKYVNSINDGRAIVLLGDFNFRYNRDLADDMYNNLIVPTGLKDVWNELYNGGNYNYNHGSGWNPTTVGESFDRVLYKSGDNVTLEPQAISYPSILGANGERYTDHSPTEGTLSYTVTGKETVTAGEFTSPVAPDPVEMFGAEFVSVIYRLLQIFTSLYELVYLAGQGIAILQNK